MRGRIVDALVVIDIVRGGIVDALVVGGVVGHRVIRTMASVWHGIISAALCKGWACACEGNQCQGRCSKKCSTYQHVISID